MHGTENRMQKNGSYSRCSRSQACFVLPISMVLLLTVAFADLAHAKAPTVAGVAVFEGERPERSPIQFVEKEGKLSECHSLHEEGLLNENLMINDDGAIANVFVYVSSGLRRRRYYSPFSDEAVVLNQAGCMFRPRVLGIMARQKLTLKNSDPLLHNVRALSFRNRPFNIAQPAKSPDRETSFRSHELAIMIQCDLHPWMIAHVFVMSHPFFAVTGESGRFDIPGLPRGDYTLTAWHEELGKETTKIRVTDTQLPDIKFTFKLKEKKTKVMQGRLAAASPGAPAVETTTDSSPRRFVKKWQLGDLESALTNREGHSAERGRTVFQSAGCNKCHVIAGKGTRLGPELTDVSRRFTGANLLQQILSPSAEINKEFLTQLFLTREGKTVSGLVIKEDDTEIQILPNPLKPEQVTVLQTDEVELRRTSPVSTMPESLLDTFEKQEILDLLRFLESEKKSSN